MKKITFITDIHLNESSPATDPKKNWTTIIEDLKSRGIGEVVFGGDIGDQSAHQWFFDTLQPFSLHLILGNHDRFDQVSSHYRKGSAEDELFYSVEADDYKFIFLDSSSAKISEQQLNWLKAETDTLKRIVLFIHHPVLAVDTPVDRVYPLQNRNELQHLLQATGKEITIFCGHYHMNDEQTEENIRQIITQASSFQVVKPAKEIVTHGAVFGYRVIEFCPDGIGTELVTFEGK